MPAPVASGWSGRRVGLAPTGKAPPCHGARGERTIQAVQKSRLSAEFPRLGQSVDPCVEPCCARLDVVGVEPPGPARDCDGHYVRPILPAQRRHPCVRSYHIPLIPTSELGELHHDPSQFAVHCSPPLLVHGSWHTAAKRPPSRPKFVAVHCASCSWLEYSRETSSK